MLSRAGPPQAEEMATGTCPEALRDLRAVVLLAGSVRATHLRKATGRSLLDLPVRSNCSVLEAWVSCLADAAGVFGMPHMTVRVMLDRGAALPTAPDQGAVVTLQIEQDPFDLRGTGGLLSDLARDYGDHDYILVANAAQVLVEPLSPGISALAAAGADVAIACLADGTPSDFILVRCGTLRSIKPVGFVDFKEQALPQIAREHDVRVVRRDRLEGLPIRTRDGYLNALLAYHRRLAKSEVIEGLPPEDWRQTFALIEDGADVHPSAVIHDSVVLAGGTVRAGAVVVRSVVCADGVVESTSQIVDTVVQSSGNDLGSVGL